MTKYKVSELEGALLDAAVAIAEGKRWRIEPTLGLCFVPKFPVEWASFSPHKFWEQGGQIILRERLIISPHAVEQRVEFGWQTVTAWVALAGVPYGIEDRAGLEAARKFIAPTPLIAAMRAYVASKLGDEVELP